MKAKTTELFGNPTPIGLIGLAIGCMVLAPIEFGWTSGADPQAWRWMLLTAGVLQIYAGVVDLINKNVLGATTFTVYGVLWVCNSWVTSAAMPADPITKGFIYLVFLALSMFLLIGFLYVSRNLAIVLVEFVLIFVANLFALFNHDLHKPMALVIGILLVLVAIQCMWAAAGGVINNIVGRNLFPQGPAPLSKATGKEQMTDDFASVKRHQTIREQIVHVLYQFWEKHGFEFTETTLVMDALKCGKEELVADFQYLYYKGYVARDEESYQKNPDAPKRVHLTAQGLDYYTEAQMNKFKF